MPEDLPDLSKAINREPDQSDERSTLHGFEYRFVEETVRIKAVQVDFLHPERFPQIFY